MLMILNFWKNRFLKFSSRKLLSLTHYEDYLSIITYFYCILHRHLRTICLFYSKFVELLISRISDNVFCRTILKPEKGVLSYWLFDASITFRPFYFQVDIDEVDELFRCSNKEWIRWTLEEPDDNKRLWQILWRI